MDAKANKNLLRIASRILTAYQDIQDLLANCEDSRVTGRRPDPAGAVTLSRGDLAQLRRANGRIGKAVRQILPETAQLLPEDRA